MGSPATTTTANQRPRLLICYARALITIVHKAYRRVEGLHGPVGSLACVVASMARSIVHPLEHLWLLILTFIDDGILAIGDVTMSIFPSLIPFFIKVDELAFLAKSLPKIFDDFIDGLHALVHQVSMFVWALAKLKKSATRKTNLDPSEETEVVVDIKCCEQQNREERNPHGEREMEETTQKASDDDRRAQKEEEEEDVREVERSCEEIMETLERMGMADEGQRREKKADVGVDEGKMVEATSQESKEGERRDAILELFDEGWQLKPLKVKKEQ